MPGVSDAYEVPLRAMRLCGVTSGRLGEAGEQGTLIITMRRVITIELNSHLTKLNSVELNSDLIG